MGRGAWGAMVLQVRRECSVINKIFFANKFELWKLKNVSWRLTCLKASFTRLLLHYLCRGIFRRATGSAPPTDKCTKLLWCRGDMCIKDNLRAWWPFFALHLTLSGKLDIWGCDAFFLLSENISGPAGMALNCDPPFPSNSWARSCFSFIFSCRKKHQFF